jgi:hypothetical protein
VEFSGKVFFAVGSFFRAEEFGLSSMDSRVSTRFATLGMVICGLIEKVGSRQILCYVGWQTSDGNRLAPLRFSMAT